METPTIHLSLSRRMATTRPSPIRDLLRLVDQPGVLSLAGGLPALSADDAERVRGVMDRVLARSGPLGPVALQYGPTEGLDALREVLGRQLGTSPAGVVVTTGSQQGLDLLARVALDPGDVVVVQSPSYLGALQSFSVAGAQIETVDGDDQGLDVPSLADRLRAGLRPKLVYVVPNFHNPTGSDLAVDRRRALAGLAERYGFFVIEDDPYGELRFSGQPARSIASFGGPVVRLGSASKVLAPGLRVGWMTGPADLLDAVAVLKQSADLHTSSLAQLVVAELLADRAAQGRHLAGVRDRSRQRADALATALHRELGDRLEVHPVHGGMFQWASAVDGTDTVDLLPVAIDAGVAFVPGAAFSVDGNGLRHALRLSFATNDPERIDVAVGRLAEAWRPQPVGSSATGRSAASRACANPAALP